MKCDKIIQEFLEQEDNLYVPFRIRLYMLFCSQCREEINNIKGIFMEAGISGGMSIPEDLTNLIMMTIEKDEEIQERNDSSLKWLASGFIILISIIMISYSDSFIWLRKYFGSELEIPVNLVLGIVITLFAAFYAGTHLDNAKRIARYLNNRKLHQ